MVEHVAHIARHVPTITYRVLGEELEVVLEREKTPPLLEAALHSTGDLVELGQRDRGRLGVRGVGACHADRV
jgi:hypothetical protein